MLYVVATPIGNLTDMTYRAVETLNEVNLIVAEDTRQSRKLLDYYEIATPMDSFHAHSNEAKLNKIIDILLEDGQDVALISDAGTPGICDPGFKLITAAIRAGVEVTPIPGPSAVAATVSVSGMPMHNFLFLGFLPLKKGRQTLFKEMAEMEYTIVFYESVHRMDKTLKQLVEFGMGDREICIGREVTKQFETFYRGRVADILEDGIELKGEFTCVLGPKGYVL